MTKCIQEEVICYFGLLSSHKALDKQIIFLFMSDLGVGSCFCIANSFFI